MKATLFLLTAIGNLYAACAASVVETVPKLRRRFIESNSDDEKSVTVMTRNLYVGFGLGVDLPTALQQFTATNLQARAVGWAAEICTLEPDLIGLQEVATISLQAGVLSAVALELSFLEYLLGTVHVGCGLSYEPFSQSIFNLDASSGNEIVNENVILVNTDKLDVEGYGSGEYDTQFDTGNQCCDRPCYKRPHQLHPSQTVHH